MFFRGLIGHTYWLKQQYHVSPAYTLLDLAQNLVKLLVWEHITDFTSVVAQCRQPAPVYRHALKHLHSAEELFGPCAGSVRCRFTTYMMYVSLQLFWAAGQTEAMGMSTAVKEIKQLSTADADSSSPVTFRPCGCHWGWAGMSARSWDPIQLLQRSHGLSPWGPQGAETLEWSIGRRWRGGGQHRWRVVELWD